MGLRREVGEGVARVKELVGALAAAEGAAGALRERVAELERAVAGGVGGGAAVAAAGAAEAGSGSGSGEAGGTPAAEGSATSSSTPAGGPSELFRQAADLREALEKERSERATAAKLAEGRRVELGRLAAELAKEAKGKKELGEKVVRLTGEKAAAEEQIAGLREQLSSRGGSAAAAATAVAAAAPPPPRTPSAPQQAAGSGGSSSAAAGGASAAPTTSSALSPGPTAGGPGGEAFKALISGLTEENTTLKEKIDQYKATIRDLGRRITELEEGGRAAAPVAVAVAAGGSGAGNPFGSASAAVAAAAPPPSSGNPF